MKRHTSIDPKRAETIRRELLTRRAELVDRRHDEQEALRDEAGSAIMDEAEASAADLAADLDLSLMALRAETIQHIDEAIARLATGRYGRCATCGGEIPPARLRALPFADECRHCAEMTEASRLSREQPALTWGRHTDV